MSRSLTRADGHAIAVFASLSLAIAACHATPASHLTATDAGLYGVEALEPALHRSDLAVLTADAVAARERGDWQNLRRFQAALVDRVGVAAISAARSDYKRTLVDLHVADRRGDARVRAAIRVQLRSICGPGSVVRAFETCAVETMTWGS
jgi:hypothetical protein